MNSGPNLLDEPIVNAAQDVLGRADFANSVAELILSAPKGLCSQVIGLYGKWGEGKTSTKNLILEKYKAKRGRDYPLVEFSPWEYAEGSRLPFLFFNAVANSYGKETNEETAMKLAKKFQALGYLLDLVAYVPKFTPIAKTLSGLTNLAHKYLSKKVVPLLSVRDDIERLLIEDTRRLIVVVDDLDRLSAENVRRMIQLVKANGDFPNMTYLLLCDRDYVGRALCPVVDGNTEKDGREYLEKIVSFGLDLPRIRSSDLRAYLVGTLKDVLDRHQVKDFNPALELSSIVFQMLHDLRDVKRLISGFEFQLAAHRKKGGGTASAHLGDLIALEACRQFEPAFYHAIYKSKRQLMCEEESIYSDKRSVLSNEWIEKNLTCFISDQHPEIGVEFIEQILGWQSGKQSADGQYQRCDVSKLKIQFRLAHPDCFERYFNLYADPTEFSKADLQEFGESLNAQTTAVSALRKMFEGGRLRDFLSTIEGSFKEDDSRRRENYVAALTLAGEFAQDSMPAMHLKSNDELGFSLATHLHRCIRFFLERAMSGKEMSDLLMEVFRRETNVVVVPVSILSAEMASRERQAAVSRLLQDNAYTELKEMCVKRIEDLQLQGKLIGHIDERECRQTWLAFGDSERVRSLLADDFLSYPAVIHALLPFTGYSSSAAGTFYTVNLDGLQKVGDPEKIRDLLMAQASLPQVETGIRDCLSFSIDAKTNNQPYDHDAQMKQVYKRTF